MSRRWRLPVFSFLLTVGLAEVSLQAFYYFTAGDFLFRRVARPIYASEPHAEFAVRPHLAFPHRTNEFQVAIHTNSRGFRVSPRHEEYAAGPDASRFRVLLLGSSFAFGWGVNYEDTFGARLAGLLPEGGLPGDRPVEVLNAGVPALLPAPQLNWYEHVGHSYRPDLVVQLIYGSMIVPANKGSGARVDAAGYLVRDATVSQRAIEAAKNSALIFYGWILSRRLATAWSGASPGGIQGAGREIRTPTRFDPAERMAAESLRFYGELREATLAGGARLLIVFVPLSYSVHEQDIARWKHLGVGEVASHIAFNRAFCDYLNSTGFHCVNTTAALGAEARTSGRRLYYWLDIHWTPLGNQIAARAVADYLLSPPQRAWLAGKADSPWQRP